MKALTTPGRPTLSAKLVLPMRRALEAAGHDATAFLNERGITPELLEDASGRIDHELVLRVLDDASVLTKNPWFHLSAAELVLQGDTDAFGYAARACRTAREAMERCVRYSRLLHDVITNRFTVEGEIGRW